MPSIFAVARPLFNAKIAIQAYMLHAKVADKLFEQEPSFAGDALSAPAFEIVEQLGTDPFSGDMPVLVRVSEFQLLSDFPQKSNIATDRITYVVNHSVLFNDTVIDKCAELKDKGFVLALEGYAHELPLEIVFKHFDYLILDYADAGFNKVFSSLRQHVFRIMFIINNVPDMEAFATVSNLHGALFSGDFYAAPIAKGINVISPLKLNTLRLLGQINEEDFDLVEVSGTIERDAALSMSLLRFLNGAGGFRGVRKVESIRQAVAIMGQSEVKRWAMVAITTHLADDRPSEVTRLSLIRGKFAENLAGSFGLGMLKPSLFIAGLFSLLDVILQMPMKDALAEIAIDTKIYNALVNKSGEIYNVMELVTLIGQCDWYEAGSSLHRYMVDPNEAAEAYIDALIWYRDLIRVMDEEAEEEAEGETIEETE